MHHVLNTDCCNVNTVEHVNNYTFVVVHDDLLAEQCSCFLLFRLNLYKTVLATYM